MVTDGGHFENLALYEMILRRCKYIVLSDGAADESFKFGEIANAIQKCKVDLGVDIDTLFLDGDDEGVQLGPVDQGEEAVEIVPIIHERVEVDCLGGELIWGGGRCARDSGT